MRESADHTYASISVGDVFEFKRTITQDDVIRFAQLSGDHNPLHIDEGYGRASQFGRNIVHGMLAASLFSTLVGMYCPGKRCLYLSQSSQFRLPVFADDEVVVKGTVLNKTDALSMITLKTEIIKAGKVAITGEAKVKVLGDNHE